MPDAVEKHRHRRLLALQLPWLHCLPFERFLKAGLCIFFTLRKDGCTTPLYILLICTGELCHHHVSNAAEYSMPWLFNLYNLYKRALMEGHCFVSFCRMSNSSICSVGIVRCQKCSSENRRCLFCCCVSVTPTSASLVKRKGPAVEECSLAHNPSPC